MANDGRVSSVLVDAEYAPTDVGHASGVLLFPEYDLTAIGHVSSLLVFPDYLPSTVGHASAVFLFVEYAQASADTVLVQGEEQLQMTQFQGSELEPGPGQV